MDAHKSAEPFNPVLRRVLPTSSGFALINLCLGSGHKKDELRAAITFDIAFKRTIGNRVRPEGIISTGPVLECDASPHDGSFAVHPGSSENSRIRLNLPPRFHGVVAERVTEVTRVPFVIVEEKARKKIVLEPFDLNTARERRPRSSPSIKIDTGVGELVIPTRRIERQMETSTPPRQEQQQPVANQELIQWVDGVRKYKSPALLNCVSHIVDWCRKNHARFTEDGKIVRTVTEVVVDV